MPIIKKTPISSSASTDTTAKEIEEGQIALDVYKTKDKIVVICPMAGVNPDEVNVSITDDVLTIRGERKLEEEINEEDYYARECYWGSFSRSIILPSAVDKSKISAVFTKYNVLRIEIPRIEEVNTKSISIKKEKE